MYAKELIKAALRTLSPSSTADVEHSAGQQPLQETKAPQFVSQVDVRVHQARHRLCDPDGASVKAVLDAIVAAGLLRDDGPEEIREVRFTQQKIGTNQIEYTRIVIEEVQS